ncbi:hypothetical protein CJO89_22165 (plasmid) [Ralstonia solanacearum]|nr:hypothetical protein CJO89_22165 [Ralstonia solanacearum]
MRTIDPVKHEKRRQEILAAADRCFRRDGFRGASISNICAEARMSSGTSITTSPARKRFSAPLSRQDSCAAPLALRR